MPSRRRSRTSANRTSGRPRRRSRRRRRPWTPPGSTSSSRACRRRSADEAIGSDQSQKFVYLVDGESKAQYRTVKIGPLVDGLRVVREGVGPEDRVVVAGLQRVRPGLKVDAQEEPIPSPPAAEVGGATPATTPASEPPADAHR